MEPEAMTTQELTTAVAGRVGEVWAVLDRLAAGRKALAAAELAGDLDRVARVKTKLAEVESLIADYRELERRSPRVIHPVPEHEAERYGQIHGYETPPKVPCSTCGGAGWHPPCRRPVGRRATLRGVQDADLQPGQVRSGGTDSPAPA